SRGFRAGAGGGAGRMVLHQAMAPPVVNPVSMGSGAIVLQPSLPSDVSAPQVIVASYFEAGCLQPAARKDESLTAGMAGGRWWNTTGAERQATARTNPRRIARRFTSGSPVA